MAAYASISQLVERFDARTLGDLVSDDGTRVVEGLLSSNAKLTAALEDASGQIEAALLMGGRYATSDLTGLTGNSAKYLIRLTCEIAFAMLWERRPYADDQRRAKALEKAEEHLEMLRKGSHIFDVSAVKTAGVPSVSGPTTVELIALNFLRDKTQHFYPTRAGRLPDSR